MGERRGILVTLAAAILLVGIVLGGLALGGDGNDDDQLDAGGDDVIRLEAIGTGFPGDFTSGLDLRSSGAAFAIALPDVPPLGAALGEALAGRAMDGNEPGLYGGSRDIGTCDVEQLVDFLTDPANAALAQAWAGVHEIEVGEIAEFVDSLTPVRLRFDTRVTNHGFRDGRATSLQSVLQAGTAVLVDARGVPRAKCACGNPLLPPAAGGGSIDESAAWDGFDPERIVAVEEASRPVAELVLVDVDDGVLFTRALGTDGDADEPIGAGDALCGVFSGSPSCTGEVLRETVVPDVTGADLDTASAALLAAGFTGGITERLEASDTVPAGIVIRTEPPAGREVPLKSPIVVIVSSGTAPPPSTTSTTPTTRRPGSTTSTTRLPATSTTLATVPTTTSTTIRATTTTQPPTTQPPPPTTTTTVAPTTTLPPTTTTTQQQPTPTTQPTTTTTEAPKP